MYKHLLKTTQTLLGIFRTYSSKQDMLDDIVKLLQRESLCQFVGIRVIDQNGCMPYQAYLGFSRAFWEKENMLQLGNEDCSCTRIVSGHLLPFDMQIITPSGSLYCNDTTVFATSLSEGEKEKFRGACLDAGYRSVAIIPIIYNSHTVGLIHLADLATHKISPDTVEFIESIAPLVGEIINRNIVEHSLKISETKQKFLESLVSGISTLAYVADLSCYEIIYASDMVKELYGPNITGRKCYELLFSRQTPCPSCAECLQEIESTELCVTEQYDQRHDCYYLSEKKALRWLDTTPIEVTFGTDITQKKKAEQKLLASNLNLKKTVQQLQDIHASLKEEISEKQQAQQALQRLNAELEEKISQRTQALQTSNVFLEKEIKERKKAQIALSDLNKELEEKVYDRTQELLKSNNKLKSEIAGHKLTLKELRQSHDKLSISEARYELLFENMFHGVASCKMVSKKEHPTDFIFLSANHAFKKTSGFYSIAGKTLTQVLPNIKETAPDFWETCCQVALTGRPELLEKYIEQLHAWFLISVYSTHYGHVFMIFDNITERKKNEEQISRLAYFDALTSLPNRISFNEYLEKTLRQAHSHETSGAVMYIDLDDLKLVNETYGHTSGDSFIIAAGKCLTALADSNLFVARIGGDEFALVAENRNRKEISELANHIVGMLGQEYELSGTTFHLSASVGIAFYPDDGDTGEEILKNADNALYAAKKAGKNGWQFYQEQWQKEMHENMLLVNSLRRAIEHNELVLFYQPQMSFATHSIVGYEALLRWNSPEHGLIPPARFIPLAEQHGLIQTIGQWVIKEACLFALRLSQNNLGHIKVALNVSPYQLSAGNFVKTFKSILQETGANPQQVEVEITESALITSLEESNQKLRKLKNLGITLSLDDFGTGYASLTYLQQLSLNSLKIDKSFISSINDGDVRRGIIAAIVNMAHVLNMTVVAEGVETEEQFHYLSQIHCDMFQGYLISPPLPEEKALQFYESNLRKIGDFSQKSPT